MSLPIVNETPDTELLGVTLARMEEAETTIAALRATLEQREMELNWQVDEEVRLREALEEEKKVRAYAEAERDALRSELSRLEKVAEPTTLTDKDTK